MKAEPAPANCGGSQRSCRKTPRGAGIGCQTEPVIPSARLLHIRAERLPPWSGGLRAQRAMSDANTNGKHSILIVDDNPGEVHTLRIGLDLEGFDATGVTNGDEALTTLSNRSYSVMLIDMMMPGMNGLELARAVKSIRPGMPTILMSAYHLSPVQLARADTGAVGFVPKPFDFDELVYFIRRKIGAEDLDERTTRHPGRAGLPTPFDVPNSAS
jgi:CheY-like chemotaxis protein